MLLANRDTTEELIAQAKPKERPSMKDTFSDMGLSEDKDTPTSKDGKIDLSKDMPKIGHLLWYNEKALIEGWDVFKSEGYNRGQIDPFKDKRRISESRVNRSRFEELKRGWKIGKTAAGAAGQFAAQLAHTPYATSWLSTGDAKDINLYTKKGEKRISFFEDWWRASRHYAGYTGPTHYVADTIETVAETVQGVYQIGAGAMNIAVDTLGEVVGSDFTEHREDAVKFFDNMVHYQLVQRPLALMIGDLMYGDSDTVREVIVELAKSYTSFEDIENQNPADAAKRRTMLNMYEFAKSPIPQATIGMHLIDKIFNTKDLSRRFKMWAAGVEITEKDVAEVAQALMNQYDKIKLDDKDTAMIRQFAHGALGHWDSPEELREKLRKEPTEVALDVLDIWLGAKGFGKGRIMTGINKMDKKAGQYRKALRDWRDARKNPDAERIETPIGTPDAAQMADLQPRGAMMNIELGDLAMHRRQVQGDLQQLFDSISDDIDNFTGGVGAEAVTPEGVRMPMPTPNEMRDRVNRTERSGRPEGRLEDIDDETLLQQLDPNNPNHLSDADRAALEAEAMQRGLTGEAVVDGDEFPDWADDTEGTGHGLVRGDDFPVRANQTSGLSPNANPEQVERVRNAISPNPWRTRDVLELDALDYLAEIAVDWDNDALQMRMIEMQEVVESLQRPIRRDEVDEIIAFAEETDRLFPDGIHDMDLFNENARRYREMINRFEENTGRDPIYGQDGERISIQRDHNPQQPFSDTRLEVRRNIDSQNASAMLEEFGEDLRTSEGRDRIRENNPGFTDSLRAMVANRIAWRREGLTNAEASEYSQAIQDYYSTPMREHTISDAWFNIEVPDDVPLDRLPEEVAQRLEEELYIEFQDDFPIPRTARENYSEAERLELERRDNQEPHPFSVEGQRSQAERRFEQADPRAELQSLRGDIDAEMEQRNRGSQSRQYDPDQDRWFERSPEMEDLRGNLYTNTQNLIDAISERLPDANQIENFDDAQLEDLRALAHFVGNNEIAVQLDRAMRDRSMPHLRSVRENIRSNAAEAENLPTSVLLRLWERHRNIDQQQGPVGPGLQGRPNYSVEDITSEIMDRFEFMRETGQRQTRDFEVTSQEIEQIANREMDLSEFTQDELNQLHNTLINEIDTAAAERAAIVVGDELIDRESMAELVRRDQDSRNIIEAQQQTPNQQNRLDPSDPRNQGWNPRYNRQLADNRQRREVENRFDSREDYPEPFNILERADEIRDELDALPPNASRQRIQALEQELAEAMAAFRRRLPGGGTRLYTGVDPTEVAKLAKVAVSKVKAFLARAKENFTVDKDDWKIALAIWKKKLDRETVDKVKANYQSKMAQKAAILDMIQKIESAAKEATKERKPKHERGKFGQMTKEGAARPLTAGVKSLGRTFAETGSAWETVKGFFKAIDDAKAELTLDRARMGLPKKGLFFTKSFLHNLDAALGKVSTEIIAKALDEAGYTSDPKTVSEIWKGIKDEAKGQFGVAQVLQKLNEAREEVAVGIEIDAFTKHKLRDKRGELVTPQGKIEIVLDDKTIKELNWYAETLDTVYKRMVNRGTSQNDPAFLKVRQNLVDFINRRKELNMTHIDAVWESMIHDPKLKDHPIIEKIQENIRQTTDPDRKHNIARVSIAEVEHAVINAFLGEPMDNPLQVRDRATGRIYNFKIEDIEDLYQRIQHDPEYQAHRDFFNSIYNSVEINDYLKFWNDISARFLHTETDKFSATSGLDDERVYAMRKMMQEGLNRFAFEKQKDGNFYKEREDFRTLSKGIDQLSMHLDANHNQLMLNAVGDRIKNPDKMKKFFLNDASPKDIRNLITFLLEDGRKTKTARFTTEAGMAASDPGKITMRDLKKGLKSENPAEWTPKQQVIMLRAYLIEELIKELRVNVSSTPSSDNVPQISGAELTNIHKFKRTLENIGHDRGVAIFGEDVWNDLMKMTLTSHWAQRASRMRGDKRGGFWEIAEIPERIMLHLRKVKAGTEYRRTHKTGDPDPPFRELIGALAIRMKEWKPPVQLVGRRLEEATDKPEKLQGNPYRRSWLEQNVRDMMRQR